MPAQKPSRTLPHTPFLAYAAAASIITTAMALGALLRPWLWLGPSNNFSIADPGNAVRLIPTLTGEPHEVAA